MRRFMIADDSAVICKVAKRIMTGLDYLVIEASNAGEAMIMCDAQLPDVLCVDAGMTGALDLISSVRQMEGGSDVRIYYLMIEKEFKQMMAGKRAGADDFLLKPFDRRSLTEAFAPYAAAA
ncbi:response regulator [uncultured Hoeflea sp.]|jgi:two-component system, chemotaxis family, chemotaxis protein CheY|uniref:response regulator n=1 Tax=uncultured Hoeflea sp. TaxID=538666 RepID=UPI0030D7AD06